MLNFKTCGDGCPFWQISWVFCSNSRACHLASLPRQTKPSGLKLSRAKWNLGSQASHITAKQRKPREHSKTKLKQSKQSKAKQASKRRKITSLASLSQTRASKLNTSSTARASQVNKANQIKIRKQSKPKKASKRASKWASEQEPTNHASNQPINK